MSQRLAGKVSIITGSTSGLGAATAERFAAEGARVVVSGRSEERGARVVDSIRKTGGDAFFVRCDLADERSIRALLESAVARYGRVDDLIANAATTATASGEKTAGILDLDNQLLETSIATNIRGFLWLLKHTLPALVASARPHQRKTSSIVAIGTSGTRNGTPRMPIYFSTKAPVEIMVRSLASEFGGRGVRVNCVSAGLIETESEMRTMTEEFRRHVMDLNGLPSCNLPRLVSHTRVQKWTSPLRSPRFGLRSPTCSPAICLARLPEAPDDFEFEPLQRARKPQISAISPSRPPGRRPGGSRGRLPPGARPGGATGCAPFSASPQKCIMPAPVLADPAAGSPGILSDPAG